jgi:hypothetical protein
VERHKSIGLNLGRYQSQKERKQRKNQISSSTSNRQWQSRNESVSFRYIQPNSLYNIAVPPKPAEQTGFLGRRIRSGIGHAIPTTTEADSASGEEQQDEGHECQPETYNPQSCELPMPCVRCGDGSDKTDLVLYWYLTSHW